MCLDCDNFPSMTITLLQAVGKIWQWLEGDSALGGLWGNFTAMGPEFLKLKHVEMEVHPGKWPKTEEGRTYKWKKEIPGRRYDFL